jgi:WD40 repeat protein
MQYRSDNCFPVAVLIALLIQSLIAGNAAATNGGGPASTVRSLIASGCLAPAQTDPSAQELGVALSNCPPVDPIFRIESGINTAKINRIAADAQCTVIATASEDKTARVYRGDGSALSVLRPPIGPGNGGKLRAVTVSPDGRLVVVGSWDVAVASTASDSAPSATTDNGLYVFDASNGALLSCYSSISICRNLLPTTIH